MALSGKTIVITGASSGIGAEIARVVKAAGARIIAVDLNEPKAGADSFIQADLSRPDEITRAAAALPESFDGLVNSAGLPPTRGRAAVLTVNFMALRAFTEAVVDRLADGSGIVNLSSLAGFEWAERVEKLKAFLELRDFDRVEIFCEAHRITDANCYFFSKEAVNVWTMLNRWTWRERGIRMNSICPGPVDTPLLPEFLSSLGERAEEDMRIMDRAGTPEDVAPLAAFLLDEGSAWLRGTNVPCDGGMHAHILTHMTGLE